MQCQRNAAYDVYDQCNGSILVGAPRGQRRTNVVVLLRGWCDVVPLQCACWDTSHQNKKP